MGIIILSLILLKILFFGFVIITISKPVYSNEKTQTLKQKMDQATFGQMHLIDEDYPNGIKAPLVSTNYLIDISGTISRTKVVQRFINTSDSWVEGLYLFPLPPSSSVDHLRMRIGETFIEGQIKERKKAKRIYEKAKSSGKKAALLQQQRPNLFSHSVANIGPNETVIIEIEFQQALAPKDNRWEIRLPLVAPPLFEPKKLKQNVSFSQNGFGTVNSDSPYKGTKHVLVKNNSIQEEIINPVNIQIKLSPGFELNALESPFHKVSVLEQPNNQFMINLTDAAPANRDFVLRWKPKDNKTHASLFKEVFDNKNHYLVTLTPPKTKSKNLTIDREVIFIQDISGSMKGESLKQAINGLEMGLKSLKPNDYFNLIIFNDNYSTYADAPLQATPEEIEKAINAIHTLKANGGTDVYPALDYALSNQDPDINRLRQVIFLTDGDVGNEAALFNLVSRKLGKSRLFTVGIGSAPNGYFMKKMAETGRGENVFIGSVYEVAQRMRELFAKIESPAITNLKITFPDNKDIEYYPKVLPDVYNGSPFEVSIRSKDEIKSAVLTGKRGDQHWEVRMPFSVAGGHSGVAKLWARSKIAAIESERFSTNSNNRPIKEIDMEILNTALDYKIMSRLSSLVAVAVKTERPLSSRLFPKYVALSLPEGWDPRFFQLGENETRRGFISNLLYRPVNRVKKGLSIPDAALNYQTVLIFGIFLLMAGFLMGLLRTQYFKNISFLNFSILKLRD
jgi:Ca-activated chloride channel family protein